MIRRPPRSTRTDTPFPPRRSSDLPANVTESGELDMDHFRSLLNPRTRLVAVAHVSNALGTINPVTEITRQIGRHTSELQSLMRISYAVFCLQKKQNNTQLTYTYYNTNLTQSYQATHTHTLQ